LNEFDGARGNDDGQITKQEWDNYYAELAMSCPSETYFVRVLEQAWGLSEESDGEAFKEQVADFLSKIRLRLLEMSNQSTEEFVLRKIFNHFDKNHSGTITIDELDAMMAGLKLSVERKYLNGIFRIIDENNSGTIEFDEFLNYVVNDPYKV
jgi:Ca2+-binding EF-hand superfamily protein